MAAKEVATTAVLKEVPTASDRSKSHPYFTQKLRLHSFHAQQVFDRGFDLCTTAIFSLSVVLRIIGTDDQARDVEGIVDERLSAMFEEIRGEVCLLYTSRCV